MNGGVCGEGGWVGWKKEVEEKGKEIWGLHEGLCEEGRIREKLWRWRGKPGIRRVNENSFQGPFYSMSQWWKRTVGQSHGQSHGVGKTEDHEKEYCEKKRFND